MKRSTRQIIGLSGMILLFAPVTCFGPSYFLNVHTLYCPITHKIREGSVCVVLDTDGRRTLIQHANLDDDDAYLEIHREAGSRHFELPSSVSVLAPVGYAARLIDGREDTILLDGHVTPLVVRR